MSSWSFAVIAALSTMSAASCLRSSGTAVDAGPNAKLDAASVAPPAASSITASQLQPPPLGPPDAGPSDDAKPGPVDQALKARLAHLVDAIAHDNADLATDLLFPRDAYVAARDSSEAGKAWERNVNRSYKTRVHHLHMRNKALDSASNAQVVAVELGRIAPVPMKTKGWKIPLWSARGSKIVVDVNGKTVTLHVKDMTSWRGSWYIVTP